MKAKRSANNSSTYLKTSNKCQEGDNMDTAMNNTQDVLSRDDNMNKANTANNKEYSAMLSAQVDKVVECRTLRIKELDSCAAKIKCHMGLLGNIASLNGEYAGLDKFYDPINDTIRGLSEVLGEYEQLHKRFSRETVNIGGVGLPGQGKSLLLRSLSGLDNSIIPDGKGSFVTGARSMIIHKNNTVPYADVETYNEKDFMDEIIAGYYDSLEIGPAPANLDEFKAQDLENISLEEATKRSTLEYLRNYQRNIDKYRHLLTGETLCVKSNEIREYVAQHNADTGDEYYKYMAVRIVRIYCSFPHLEMGRVALLDMPGLGENRAGEKERLLKTISDEVDLVMFVKKPEEDRAAWEERDTELYDTAGKAFSVEVSKMSVMVLNHKDGVDGGNSLNCHNLKTQLQHDSHMQPAITLIADVSKAEDARVSVAMPVLEYLAENIDQLDNDFSESFFEKVEELFEETHSLAVKITREVDGANTDKDQFFNRKFQSFWNKVCIGLGEHVNKLKGSNNPEEFHGFLMKTIEGIGTDVCIPETTEITDKAHETGSFKEALGWYLKTIRNKITWHFQTMDKGLGDFFENEKKQVADVLCQAGVKQLGDASGKAWLSEVNTKICAARGRGLGLNELERAFDHFCNYEIGWQGFVLPRARKELVSLSLDKVQTGKINNASDVQRCLQKSVDDVVGETQTQIEGLFDEIHDARFAMTDSFADRVRYSEFVKDEWRDFLRQNVEELWSCDLKLANLIKKIIKLRKYSA